MADYTMTLTAAQINTAVNAVHNADTIPTTGSSDMVTSGAVFAYSATVDAATRVYVDARTHLTSEFISTQQTIPAINTTLSVAHGLGATPKVVSFGFYCAVTANGYTVGDEVVCVSDNGATNFFVTWKNATEVGFRFNTAAVLLAHKTTSDAVFTPSDPNWKILVRAWV